MKLETIAEGPSVQMLHVGSYGNEIYLSDPRRVPASRLRTILRHPVRRALRA